MLTIEISQIKVSRRWITTTRQYHYPHDKPACTHWRDNGQKYCEAYYLNSQRHRENDKPALMYWKGNGQKHYENYIFHGRSYEPGVKPC